MIDLITNYLPWKDEFKINYIHFSERIKEILKIKELSSAEILCKGLPEEFVQYIKYCKNLEFEQDPNYDYLRSLFTSILTKNYLRKDLIFFWINNKIEIEKESKSFERSNIYKRRQSPQKRLYNKIKTNLEKEKIYKSIFHFKSNLSLEHINSINISSLDNSDNKDKKYKLIKPKNHINNNKIKILKLRPNLKEDFIYKKNKVNLEIENKKYIRNEFNKNINLNILVDSNNKNNNYNPIINIKHINLYNYMKNIKKMKSNINNANNKSSSFINLSNKKIEKNNNNSNLNDNIINNNIYRTFYERETEKSRHSKTKYNRNSNILYKINKSFDMKPRNNKFNYNNNNIDKMNKGKKIILNNYKNKSSESNEKNMIINNTLNSNNYNNSTLNNLKNYKNKPSNKINNKNIYFSL